VARRAERRRSFLDIAIAIVPAALGAG